MSINIEDLTIGQLREITRLAGSLSAPSETSPDPVDGVERAVVVCTKSRAVIFGYTKNPDAKPLRLRGARNAFWWKCSEGVWELAETGPKDGSKVGARANITIREEITCVMECSAAAVAAWEAIKWSK